MRNPFTLFALSAFFTLCMFLTGIGFYMWGYHTGTKSPCQDVEATDIFKIEPK